MYGKILTWTRIYRDGLHLPYFKSETQGTLIVTCKVQLLYISVWIAMSVSNSIWILSMDIMILLLTMLPPHLIMHCLPNPTSLSNLMGEQLKMCYRLIKILIKKRYSSKVLKMLIFWSSARLDILHKRSMDPLLITLSYFQQQTYQVWRQTWSSTEISSKMPAIRTFAHTILMVTN